MGSLSVPTLTLLGSEGLRVHSLGAQHSGGRFAHARLRGVVRIRSAGTEGFDDSLDGWVELDVPIRHRRARRLEVADGHDARVAVMELIGVVT